MKSRVIKGLAQIEPYIEKCGDKPKTMILVRKTVEKDGRFVDMIEEVELTPDMDVRSQLVAEDFTLSAVLANDGIQSLKECPRSTGDSFDNIDRIHSTLNELEDNAEDLNANVD